MKRIKSFLLKRLWRRVGFENLKASTAAVSYRLRVAADAKNAMAAVDHCPVLPAEPQSCVIFRFRDLFLFRSRAAAALSAEGGPRFSNHKLFAILLHQFFGPSTGSRIPRVQQ